jgi:phage-related protein
MSYQIEFYETPSSKPILDFVQKLHCSSRAKILRKLDLLENYGFKMSTGNIKKVYNQLFELRIRGKEELRLFFTHREEIFYILHIFKKKTNKTPKKEIAIAAKRLEQI